MRRAANLLVFFFAAVFFGLLSWRGWQYYQAQRYFGNEFQLAGQWLRSDNVFVQEVELISQIDPTSVYDHSFTDSELTLRVFSIKTSSAELHLPEFVLPSGLFFVGVDGDAKSIPGTLTDIASHLRSGLTLDFAVARFAARDEVYLYQLRLNELALR